MLNLNDGILRIIGVAKDKVFKGPEIANIYINSNCNINCSYCWFYSPLNKQPEKFIYLEWKKFKEIIDQLYSLGTNTILLSANGEPWLHPNINRMIKYIKTKKMYLRVTTNLTFSSEAHLATFSEADQLAVNLSASNKDAYQEIHSKKQDLFEKIIRNLRFYLKIYQQRNKPEIEIRYIIFKENIKDIPSMVDLAIGLGITRMKFTLMDPTKYTKNLMITKNEEEKLKETIEPLLQEKLTIQTNLKEIYESLNNYSKSIFNLSQCFVGWFRISIELNGDVGFCCQNDKLIFGNVNNGKTIEQMWYSQKAQNLRLNAKYNLNIKKPFWQVCRYCSIAHTNQEIKNKYLGNIEEIQNEHIGI